MIKTIGKKNKVYLIETVITILLILFLIVLCIYRAINNEFGIAVMMVLVGLSVVGLYWFFKEFKNLLNYLKSPNDLLQIDDDFIYINEYKKTSKIHINQIKEIKVMNVVKKLLAHEATLYIKDEENEYFIKYLKDIDNLKNQIEELINGISIH